MNYWCIDYKKNRTTARGADSATDNITTNTPVKNAKYQILFESNPRQITQSDEELAKIAEDVSPRRYAEINLVRVKDTRLMNDNLPPAETSGWRVSISLKRIYSTQRM